MLAHIKSSIVLYNKLVVVRRSACNGGLWLKTALLLALIAFASAGWAGVALPKRVFDIEAQDLSRALIQFSEQSGLVFVIPVDLIKGKKSAAAKGYLTPVEALARLLAGSGLAGKINAEGLLHIALAEPARDNANNGERAMKQKTDGEPRKKSFFSAVASVVSTLAVGLTATGGAAIAQETGFVLEEIVVTAQKREQNLQDVGISVTAFSGSQLRALGLEDTIDLESQTPGLLIGEYGGAGATTTMNIRGVAQLDFADHQESPNAVYMDGAYVSFIGGVNVSMFDLERVEVLRGPQGTLFGRNATGGLVHLITKKPTEEFEAYADLSYAEYDKIHSQAAISGPFSEAARGRLSFSSEHHDGYYDNLTGEDIVENAAINIRGQLDVDLSDSVNVLLNARYSDTNNVNAGVYHQVGAAPNPNNDGLVEKITEANRGLLDAFCTNAINLAPTVTPPRGSDCFGNVENEDVFTVSPDTIGYFDRELFGFTGAVSWELSDSVMLTSITDYQTIDKAYLEDNDSTPLPMATFHQEQDADQISQEIRLNGDTGLLEWVLGGYYLNIDSDARQQVVLSFFDLDFYDDFSHETESWAVFGQAEYALTDQFSIIGGLRWTEDEKEIDLLNDCLDTDAFGFGGTCVAFGVAVDTRIVGGRSDGDWAGKIALNYQPNDDWLWHIGVTRGNKGGALNATVGAGAGVNLASLQIKPETLVSYEGGFKATFADGRARLNASVFYYDYEDYQAYNFIGVAVVLFNADAELVGGEVELQATPVEGLDLALGLAYVDTEVKGVLLPSGRVADQEMPFAPEISINGLAAYEWPAFNGKLRLQGDFNYVDSRFYSTVNHPVLSDEDYFLANARLTYTNQDDTWDVSVFVNNLTDVERTVYNFDLSFGAGGYGIESYAPPRWVGGSVGYRWR